MENELIRSIWDEPLDPANKEPSQSTISLLRMVQSDYQSVKQQLDQIGNTLLQREALIRENLQYAIQVSTDYHGLRLQSYVPGSTVARLGKSLLGGIAQPSVLPKSMCLEVRCLGSFEVCSPWKKIERWKSVKAKSLLQYLMTRPRKPVVKDILMETLWPNVDPRSAGNNLKAAVHALRRTLAILLEHSGDFHYILFQQGSYQLDPEIDLWVDVEEFERRWMLGLRLEKEGRLSQAIQQFKSAEALYRGDYLDDEPYEDWTLLRREELKDIYLSILAKLAEHSVESAEYHDSIAYCQKILAKDHCREDAYRWLMRCHSRLGHRNRALRWYEVCRRTIEAELDTTPDRETTALYDLLFRNEPIW